MQLINQSNLLIGIFRYVIHLSSGTAGFVGAWWIGPRIKQDLDDFQPNNIIMMLVGAGILWVGWNGFVRFLYTNSQLAHEDLY
jgi:Ammonium Transporter Family